jgi:hypothetical protein
MPPQEMTGIASSVLPNRRYCIETFMARFAAGRNRRLEENPP